MEFFAYSALTTIGGIVLYIIIHLIVQAPGAALHKQFEKLGNLQGKSLDEIIAACGKPQSISPVEGARFISGSRPDATWLYCLTKIISVSVSRKTRWFSKAS